MHKNLKSLPYKEKNVIYFCIVFQKYPTQLTDIKMQILQILILKVIVIIQLELRPCIYAVSKGAEYIEKHFTCNKSLNVNTQLAHTCSMDYEDLSEIRRTVDSITLLKSSE